MSASTQILKKYRKSIKDDYSIVRSSNNGVNSNVFFELVEMSGINRSDMAEGIFDVSVKTMLRYQKENKKLNPRQSEIALKLLSLFAKGADIFCTVDSFVNWLKKPAYGLGGQIPIGLMNTNTGMDLIEEELLRIEYGALA